MTRRIAVIGAGMAAARFAQQYAAHGGEAEVVLCGAEARGPYNRTLLTRVLAGGLDGEALALPYGAPQVQVRTGCAVVALDPAARVVRLSDGGELPYDTAVLATGAGPVVPPIRGTGLAGVHLLRTLADCRRLAEHAADAARAVVVGGGVLGVSAALALAARGLPTQIVHQAPHLLERHLDAAAGDAVRRLLGAAGVPSHPGRGARAIRGKGCATGVEPAGGRVLDADLVLLACGVRPRTGLARSAGLAVRQGIVVDDTLAASEPDVHAIGDCAEHRGTVHGLAGPAFDQADVLAARLSGADPEARYTGSRPLARLTAGSLQFASFGQTADDLPGTDVLRMVDPGRGSYKKLVLRGDDLAGGILLGDLATVGDLTRAYERGEPMAGDPVHLLTAHRRAARPPAAVPLPAARSAMTTPFGTEGAV